MRKVFADAGYWVALTNPRDQWSETAIAAYEALEPSVHLVTTDEVLTEFLNYFAGWDWPVRTRASEVAREILAAEDIVVLGQSHDSFVAGLERFQRRLDKAYSLTDCISMVAMEEEGIRDVLTPDDHFRQAGFRIPM